MTNPSLETAIKGGNDRPNVLFTLGGTRPPR
ncbi:hypothetical protein BAR24066_00850 [Burkholderia arboris]|uniref:Uncharacterized protein n=1 Tax=Burkholderia arboris TaxID=488730 RepID=A0A9Q9SDX2_9BURK|nr:hypothetical protein BAR24066_00850 [Burkholderia arboris]